MTLVHVQKTSVSQSVFEQLSQGLVRGEWQPGQHLPSERELAEAMGVSRPLVREAVRRLEQAGFVAIRHGAGLTVRDFRKTGGLDLLPQLLLREEGEIDWQLVRSVLEMRSAIGPDAARWCAIRHPERGARLAEIAAAAAPSSPLSELQDAMVEFFNEIIDGSENLAYRLAYNSLRGVYDPVRDAMAEIMAPELRDQDSLVRIAAAVAVGMPDMAADATRQLLAKGQDAVAVAVAALGA